MAKKSFVKHHVTKIRYYMIMFALGYFIGFLNGIVVQNLPIGQAMMNPSSIVYGFTMFLTTIIAFEIGRNVK